MSKPEKTIQLSASNYCMKYQVFITESIREEIKKKIKKSEIEKEPIE